MNSIEEFNIENKPYRVANRVFGGVTLGQVVYVVGVAINTPLYRPLSVVMNLEAFTHELLATGELGPSIPVEQIQKREFELKADDSCVVNIETGEQYVATPNDPETGETWIQKLQGSGLPLRYQGQHMGQLMKGYVPIMGMVEQFIQDADQRLNKFA